MKSKKKKQHVSKAEITEFFLFSNYYYSKMKQYCFYSLLFYIILIERMLFQLRVELLIIELVSTFFIITTRFTILRKKAIKIKEFDFENINKLIYFFETPGDRRKKTFKSLVEKLETAYIHHYKFEKYEYIAKIFFIGFVMFFGSIILYDLIVFYFFNIVINFRVQIVENLSLAFIISTVLTIFFQLREVEYRIVDNIKKWFKNYIDEKLSNITTNIEKFIQTPSNEITNDDNGLIVDLNNWYNYYCSCFSSNNELNDLFKSYKDLIFDSEEEFFYLENFSNLKTRIKDYIQYSKLNKNIDEVYIKSLNHLLEVLNNYINLLDFSINTKRERINLKREKRRSQQTILSLILAPSSLIISIISISLNFIV